MDMLNDLLGLEEEKLEPYHMMIRAVVIFFTSLFMIRIAGIRVLGKQSSFDTLTSLMLGAVMGRAIVTNQSFFGSILATFVLMLLHRMVAWITFHNKKAGALIKGEALLLIKDGKWIDKNMLKSRITEKDVLEALRHDTNTSSLEKVKAVYLERSGVISIILE